MSTLQNVMVARFQFLHSSISIKQNIYALHCIRDMGCGLCVGLAVVAMLLLTVLWPKPAKQTAAVVPASADTTGTQSGFSLKVEPKAGSHVQSLTIPARPAIMPLNKKFSWQRVVY